MRKTVIRRLNLIQYKRSFQESWITTIRQDREKSKSRWKNSKIKKHSFFTIESNNPREKNYRNETQAIDSEKQFIENEAKKSSSYKEHKVNALASGADEGRD